MGWRACMSERVGERVWVGKWESEREREREKQVKEWETKRARTGWRGLGSGRWTWRCTPEPSWPSAAAQSASLHSPRSSSEPWSASCGTRAHTYTHVQRHTHTHVQRHTHTHTHTHTPFHFISSVLLDGGCWPRLRVDSPWLTCTWAWRWSACVCRSPARGWNAGTSCRRSARWWRPERREDRRKRTSSSSTGGRGYYSQEEEDNIIIRIKTEWTERRKRRRKERPRNRTQAKSIWSKPVEVLGLW